MYTAVLIRLMYSLYGTIEGYLSTYMGYNGSENDYFLIFLFN